jgi:SAM-dependent methyltransferase
MAAMNSYGFLAESYDCLTKDVRYIAWADYIEKHFARLSLPVKTVVDLACGTGSLTKLLAERGYTVTGVDLSPDMLAQAVDKCESLPMPPLLINQPMESLSLPGKVDAVVCCLDSINYVTRPAALKRAFSRVFRHLSEGGLFLFDVKPPHVFQNSDGELFIDETDDTYCVWRSCYSDRRHICTYFMDIFRLNANGLWARGEEVHEEYAYPLEDLERYLAEAGFSKIKRYGNLKFRSPNETDYRVFFAAEKTK